MHAQGDFADRLERAIERSAMVNGNVAKLIEHEDVKVINGEGAKPKVIEHSGLPRI